VDVRAELAADAIRVYVTDEGSGFDPASIPEPISPEQLDEASGRGLFLIRKLVDAVQFNAQGNSICMILRRS
jgi:anti-sigma regulatory factor (Ser/Thr protein kinase)